MKLNLLPVVSFLVIFLSACGAEDAADKKASDADSTAADAAGAGEVSEVAEFKFHTMLANLPSPLEMFQIISNVELATDHVELTSPEMASSLTTTEAKAYGYGVYMCDMGFMAYQQQNQQVLNYFNTCRDLAQSLGAGDVFNQTISSNFQENTSSEAQFVKMMDQGFNAMDQYMVSNERFVNATEIFVGSWIESQIIATRIIMGEPLNEKTQAVYEGIFMQKKHASNLMNVLSEIETELSPEMVTSVEDLMMFYAGFSEPSSISQEDLFELDKRLVALKNVLLK